MRTRLIFSKTTAKPYLGAVAFGNAMLERYFHERGDSIEAHSVIGHQNHPADAVMPFQHCRVAQAVRAMGPADLAVYDDIGLYACLPDESVARRTLVFFHGLAGGRAVWSGSMCTKIAVYCANSPYLARVLESVLAMPKPDGAACLHPTPFDVVRSVRLPAAETDELTAEHGRADLPAALSRALDGPDIVGHSVQPGKADPIALSAILVHLNALAAERGRALRYRLCIFEDDLASLRRLLAAPSLDPPAARARAELQGALERLRLSLDDLFIGVPWLPQPALFELMRRCRFCLGYNKVPEALGFYFLESILNGCPVYTNGSGNNRFLLPAGMGIYAFESIDMHFGDVAAYREVAERIVQGVESGSGAIECRAGAALLRQEYTFASFRRDLDACLQKANEPPLEPDDPGELVVGLSPLVRAWDGQGRVVSDYISRQLSADQIALVRDLPGARWDQVLRVTAQRRRDVEELFLGGILALSRPVLSSAQLDVRP